MKAFKKFVSAILAGAIFITFAASAVFAEEISIETSCPEIGELCENGLYFVGEKETVLEDGTLIVERSYCSIDINEISTYATSDSRPIKYQKSINIGGFEKQTLAAEIWVSGDFSWDPTNKTATVSNAKGGVAKFYNGYELVKENVESGSNQGSEVLWGHIYAYARYNVTIKGSSLFASHYTTSAYVDCNTNGISSVA